MTPKLVIAVTSEATSWALLRGQLSFFRQAGFDVTLVASPGKLLEETASREGVKAVGLPMAREPRPISDLISLARFVRLFASLRPDISHVSTPKAGMLGGIAALLTGVPIRLYTLRGIRAEGMKGIAFHIFIFFEKLCCACAMRIYCVSESLRRRALDFNLASPGKLRVLASGSSNGVDTERFKRSEAVLLKAGELRRKLNMPNDACTLLFVGRLVKDKGFMELAEAWRALQNEFPDLRLLIVGPREKFDAVPDEAYRAMGSDPRVLFTGFLEDTAPAYALADILALPTYREGFPNAPLEAAAMEIPVVATRVTGCVDAVIDGATGTLVPPRDAKALAEAIRAYLRDPELRRKHGMAGRERVLREFRPERIWKAMLAEYLTLMDEKGIPVPAQARLMLRGDHEEVTAHR